MTSTQTAPGTAQQTAYTAADEGTRLGGVGADEVKNVATEAKQQARNLMGEATTQVNDQTITQRDRLVSTLQSFSSDLEDMANRSESSGLATELAQQAAQRARDLSTRLDGRDPSDILDDVRAFARRRPGLFLLGAVAAGVVAGRVARGAKSSSGTSDSPGGTPATGYAYDTAGDDAAFAAPAAPLESGVPPVEAAYSGGPVSDSPSSDPHLAAEDTHDFATREDDPDGGSLSGRAGTPYGGTR